MDAKTINDSVGTEPFPAQGVETSGKHFQMAKQNNSLVALKVVVGSDKVKAGSTVYVTKQAQVEKHWAKTPVEYKGKQVIFVPHIDIQVVEVE